DVLKREHRQKDDGPDVPGRERVEPEHTTHDDRDDASDELRLSNANDTEKSAQRIAAVERHHRDEIDDAPPEIDPHDENERDMENRRRVRRREDERQDADGDPDRWSGDADEKRLSRANLASANPRSEPSHSVKRDGGLESKCAARQSVSELVHHHADEDDRN